MKNITVREWIDKFNHGEFDNEDFKTQCAAEWYDWFCSTKSLAKKLKKMGNIIKDIKNDYILDNFRVWFKNNCPCSYPLYDDFRFEPIKENKEDADDDVRDQFNAATHMAVIICMKFSLDVMDMILNLNARIKKRYYK